MQLRCHYPSYEIEAIGQGSFTRALLQGLRLQGEGNCATVERLCHYLSYEIPDLNRRYQKPIQTPYAVVEPASKYHLILLPQRATLQNVNQLKKDALQAEVERKALLAKHYWIRVLAVSPADWEAIQGIERLARQPAVPSGPEQTVSAAGDAAAAPPGKPASPVSQRRRRRLENKWAHDKELLDSLEQNQNALYEQRNYTSNAAERNNLDRQIEALEKEIEAALARYEATERELAALKGNDAPLPTARAEPPEGPTQTKQERPVIVAPAAPAATPAQPTFDFEVVTVDARGAEKERQRGRAEYFLEELGNGVTLEMVSIPGGSFMMGSPESEQDRYKDEGPQHRVTVSAFFMGRCAVTQAQWKVVAALPQIDRELDPDPSRFKGSERPVEQVSWLAAGEFCRRLSQKSGREYCLPSEAEWEYACRAGTTTPFHFGETITTDLANYRGTDNEKYGWSGSYGQGPKGICREETTSVGHFKVANAFGLYDMHGNVWEWCADQWRSSYEGSPADGSAWIDSENDNHSRLVRGGSWLNHPGDCRSAYRFHYAPAVRYVFIGLRVVCSGPRT